MRIYLDLVILINGWIMLLTSLSVALLRSQSIRKSRLAVGTVFMSLYCFSIYLSKGQWIGYILMIMAVIAFYRLRPWLTSVILFVVIHTTYLYSLGLISPQCDIRYHVFLIPTTFFWLISFVFGTLIIILYVQYFHQLSKHQRMAGYHRRIWLKTANQTLELTGYYDSGNQAEYAGLPIVFLKPGLLMTARHEQVVMRLHGCEKVVMVPAELSFDRQRWQWVYAGIMPDLDMENVDVLLNVHTTGG